MDSRERAWIRFYDANHSPEFYNITSGGNGQGGDNNPMWGKQLTPEHKAKISKSLSGPNNPNYGVHKYGENNPFYGHQHTEETKQILSEKNTGENNPMYGHQYTEETIQKLSESHKGERNSMYGKTHTKETINKISQANKEKPSRLAPEQVLKIVELHNQGINYSRIADQYGISNRLVSYICKGQRWSSVTGIQYKS